MLYNITNKALFACVVIQYNMKQDELLLRNIKEFLAYSYEAYGKGSYNTAITLFFKALVSIIDYHLFLKTGAIPSSHEGRFRALELKFPGLYRIIDADFPLYTESYRMTVSKNDAEKVKRDVESLIRQFKIEEKIK